MIVSSTLKHFVLYTQYKWQYPRFSIFILVSWKITTDSLQNFQIPLSIGQRFCLESFLFFRSLFVLEETRQRTVF